MIMPPPPKRKSDGKVEFQPNPVFCNEKDMMDWIQDNTPGAEVVRVWKVEMIACVVRSTCKHAKAKGKKK